MNGCQHLVSNGPAALVLCVAFICVTVIACYALGNRRFKNVTSITHNY